MAWVPGELEKRSEVLFEKLVPDQGMCETLEGESLRAINKLIYRYYNDGDYWFDGYGIETCGCVETFMRTIGRPDIRQEFENSESTEDEDYEKCLIAMLEKVVSYIESRTTYQKNYTDMLKCKPRYEPEYDDDDYDEDADYE